MEEARLARLAGVCRADRGQLLGLPNAPVPLPRRGRTRPSLPRRAPPALALPVLGLPLRGRARTYQACRAPGSAGTTPGRDAVRRRRLLRTAEAEALMAKWRYYAA